MHNIAVIVENRNLPGLDKLIQDHMKYLPGWDLDHVADQTIRNGHDYNSLLTKISFWEKYIKYDRVLIFQHDSMILRPGIDEFLEYDFIGAPIKHINFPAMNGGFSLRNPKAMIMCLNNRVWSAALGNEDIYFCHQLDTLGGNLPSKEHAQKFSVETIFGLGSFGIHQIDNYLNKAQCHEILTQYNNSLNLLVQTP